MRVISGKYKGRNLNGFNIDGTRPTMDRVKESLFGSIQGYISDSVFLDLFAGSGSIGIEALSMGARECHFVDNSNDIFNILKSNLVGIDGSYIYKNDYKNALCMFHDKSIKFDVIFLDPPYKLNLINNSIKLVMDYELLNDNGIIVCEYESEVIDDFFNLELIKCKKYGDKYISIYKNK